MTEQEMAQVAIELINNCSIKAQDAEAVAEVKDWLKREPVLEHGDNPGATLAFPDLATLDDPA